MLGISLLLFNKPKKTAAKIMAAATEALAISPQQKQQGWLGVNMPILLMYLPVHFFFTLWALSFVFLPHKVAVSVWVAFLVPYYGFTQWGHPAHTGCRQWPWLMNWFSENIEGSLRHWFGSLTVVYDGAEAAAAVATAETAAAEAAAQTPTAAVAAEATDKLSVSAGVAFDGSIADSTAARGTAAEQQLCSVPDTEQVQAKTQPWQQHQDKELAASEQQQQQAHETEPDNQHYMFGFQPHALYPTGAGFLPWMPSFKRWFPGVSPITLTATVMFFPPFIRDIACWAGFRQVSKTTFLAALKERGSVMFCPGGQAEMVHAWRAFLPGPGRQLVLHTRHKGFVRIAIEQQSSLVPVLALGEALQLRNLINLPTLQQYTYKKIGFPVPFILCGRWFVTPFPHKIPLVYVIGKPLRPPKYKAGQPMKAEDVDCLHKQYYDSLADLFVRYKHLHPDFAEARMVLKDD
eukprot:GHRR01008163.1.p1 GENE.GHRR01008163.1~~GHRR01008163.1.p1  ORF type:complete len:462 (+),score=163.26 GHRR01008163.1:336-1721(+)